MRKSAGYLVLVAVFIFLAGTAAADDILQTKDNTFFTGDIVEVTDTAVVLKTDEGVLTIDFNILTPRSVYKAKKKFVAEKDIEGTFRLGVFCEDNGLFTYAQREFETVVDLAADYSQDSPEKQFGKDAESRIPLLHRKRATARYDAAVGLFRDRKYADALEVAKEIIKDFHGTEAAEKALRLTDECIKEMKRADEEARKAKKNVKKTADEKKADKIKKAIEQAFELIEKYIEEGDKANNQGLEYDNAGNVTLATRAFQKADKAYRDAVVILEKKIALAKGVTVEQAAKGREFKRLCRTKLVLLYQNMAFFLALEATNYNESMKYVNRALILDPENRITQELRLMITQMTLRFRIGESIR